MVKRTEHKTIKKESFMLIYKTVLPSNENKIKDTKRGQNEV